MKKILLAALLAAGVVPAVSAGRAKVTLDTLVVSTDPQMHCSSCENRITEKIRFVKGTKKISASAAKQEVTIVYDKSKANFNSYKVAFAKLGYAIKKK